MELAAALLRTITCRWHHPSPPDRPWDFAVVGVQKGGTTSLTHHLSSHPELCVHGAVGSLMLRFGSSSRRPHSAHSCNRVCPKERGVVDSGASWFFGSDPERGRRMLLALSQAPSAPVRLVLLMREPIQRAFSAYNMGRSRNFSHEARYRSFDDLVERELPLLGGRGPSTFVRDRLTSLPLYPMDYLRYGLYGPQLEAMMRAGYVPGGQLLLVLISERVLRNASRERTRLWSFLGVEQHVNTSSPWDFRGRYYPSVPLSGWAVRTLHSAYRSSTERAYRAIGGAVEEWEQWYRSKGVAPALPRRGERGTQQTTETTGTSLRTLADS